MPAVNASEKAKKSRAWNADCVQAQLGAGGGTRTHTMSPSTDFESVTSANSITPAKIFPDYYTIILL